MKVDIKSLDNLDLKSKINEKLNGILDKNNLKLKVGFFETAKYENGDYVAQIAKIQEYGTLKIPKRPFFRTAIAKNQKKWLNILKSQLMQSSDIELAYNQVGEIARGDVVLSINSTNTPPNAKSTIKAKGSSKPLIDTGFLRSSVSFKVTK